MFIITSVAVASNNLRAVTHAFALCFNHWVATEGSCNGFFICATTSVLHTIVVSLHGLLGRKHRSNLHPIKTRPALIERLVKQTVHGGNKAVCISESIRQAHLGFVSMFNRS
jgi:hypothetical protein